MVMDLGFRHQGFRYRMLVIIGFVGFGAIGFDSLVHSRVSGSRVRVRHGFEVKGLIARVWRSKHRI
jgi:hypothetical protein